MLVARLQLVTLAHKIWCSVHIDALQVVRCLGNSIKVWFGCKILVCCLGNGFCLTSMSQPLHNRYITCGTLHVVLNWRQIADDYNLEWKVGWSFSKPWWDILPQTEGCLGYCNLFPCLTLFLASTVHVLRTLSYWQQCSLSTALYKRSVFFCVSFSLYWLSWVTSVTATAWKGIQKSKWSFQVNMKSRKMGYNPHHAQH